MSLRVCVSIRFVLIGCWDMTLSAKQSAGEASYRSQTKFRKGNVFTPVFDSVHGGGGGRVYPSTYWAGGVSASGPGGGSASGPVGVCQTPPGRHPG